MRLACGRVLPAIALCGVGLLNGGQAMAQSLGGDTSGATAAASSGYGTAPSYSPTAPGFLVNPAASLSMPSSSGNIFNNPMAAPLLYNSMLAPAMPLTSPSTAAGTTTGTATATSTSTATGTATSAATATSPAMANAMAGMNTAQLGMLMLMANQQNGGGGPGRLSGTRQAESGPAQPAGTLSQRPQMRPGGLASRYFNRRTSASRAPQGYFNRRPQYFP